MANSNVIERETLETAAMGWLQERVGADAEVPADLGPETDLLEKAVIDSMGFLELIAFLEDEADCTIDLMEVDPDNLTSIRGLCNHVADTVGSG